MILSRRSVLISLYDDFWWLLFISIKEGNGNSFVIIISTNVLMPHDCLETFSHFVNSKILWLIRFYTTFDFQHRLAFQLVNPTSPSIFYETERVQCVYVEWKKFFNIKNYVFFLSLFFPLTKCNEIFSIMCVLYGK